jgi:CDP-6-deoxy-D-xylo-4-hexulose-3-dehydrase
LNRLHANNWVRTANLEDFLAHLDPELYRTDFDTQGNSNYAFTLILREPDDVLRDRVIDTLRASGVEFRRGTAGGGNQLRQPYLRRVLGEDLCREFPNVEHVHFYGFYIGNYPTLEPDDFVRLCELLNSLK